MYVETYDRKKENPIQAKTLNEVFQKKGEKHYFTTNARLITSERAA